MFGAEREGGFVIFQEEDVKDLFEGGSIRGMYSGAVKRQEINIYPLISFWLIFLDGNIIAAKMMFSGNMFIQCRWCKYFTGLWVRADGVFAEQII